MIPFVQLDDGFIGIAGQMRSRSGMMGSFLSLDGEIVRMAHLDSVFSVISGDPPAVFVGLELEPKRAPLRAVANKGASFPTLPPGTMSGFPVAYQRISKHRELTPSHEAVFLSIAFAISTVQTPIAIAEESYSCFSEIFFQEKGLPPSEKFVSCFKGLQNSKSEMFQEAWEYAHHLRMSMSHGRLQDQYLRRWLALDGPPLPKGLGLAKLSFVLALLGQDCVCLDARLLGVLFDDPGAKRRWEKQIEKKKGRITERALAAYEELEMLFLLDNPYYNPQDPLGRARCQWMSWEAVGGRAATHGVWLNVMEKTDA